MDLPTSSFALLGLLAIREMSGYELAAFADKSLGYFWPMHRSLVYRELRRLEQLGYVAGTDVRQQRVPDKRVYRLTGPGRDTLVDWLSRPGFQPPQQRNEFLVKLFFARQLETAQIQALLADYREAVAMDLADLEATVGKLDAIPEGLFGQLVARHGVRTRKAMLEWTAEVEQRLGNRPTNRGTSGGGPATNERASAPPTPGGDR
jgi:PadR family transcriptional regulator AphA